MPRLQRYQAPALSCYSPPSFSLSAAQPQAARRLNPGCTNVSSNKLVTSSAASALRVNIKPFVVLILSLLSGFDVGVRMAERCSKDFPKRMGTELQVPGRFNHSCFACQPLPSDRVLAVRPLLEGSIRKVDPEIANEQPQPVRN